MDLADEIADATIKGLKKEEKFENWSDEKFSRLRTLLTTEFPDTEEATEEIINTLTELFTEEDEKK